MPMLAHPETKTAAESTANSFIVRIVVSPLTFKIVNWPLKRFGPKVVGMRTKPSSAIHSTAVPRRAWALRPVDHAIVSAQNVMLPSGQSSIEANGRHDPRADAALAVRPDQSTGADTSGAEGRAGCDP
jgi:hypothetical protein